MTYAVLEHSEYYGGDLHRPNGWDCGIPCIDGVYCVGTLMQCLEWYKDLNSDTIRLVKGEAGRYYTIARILDDDIDYRDWLDSVDWDGCPSPDGSDDDDANAIWAETRAYKAKGSLPIAYNGKLLLVDLSTDYSETKKKGGYHGKRS